MLNSLVAAALDAGSTSLQFQNGGSTISASSGAATESPESDTLNLS